VVALVQKLKPADTNNMVKLTSHGAFIVDIPETVIQQVLSIYPDENLQYRKVFADAFQSGSLSYRDLLKECDTLHIPWQLFLLSEDNISVEISKIDEQRKSKFDLSMVASRAGTNQQISLRILDRIIAFQQLNRELSTDINPFCNALKLVDRNNWIQYIIEYFEIDLGKFNATTKEKALEYLIGRIESKNICVSRGVLSNKVLPVSNELKKAYKQSSGFVVQDKAFPYIFLPSEVNRDETAGRQIYTLISLLLLVGLGEHNILVTSDFAARVKGTLLTRKIHGAVTEMLLPYEVTNLYTGKQITGATRDKLSTEYNLTPTAVVITLRERDIISADECEALLKSINPKPPTKGEFFNTPKLTTSVEKFCGKHTNTNIVLKVSNRSLSATRAQYLLFGHIDKTRFHTFKVMSKI
jgi:hypothetical protein